MAGYRLAFSMKWKEKRATIKNNDRKSLPVTGCRLAARICDKMSRSTKMKNRLPVYMNGRLPACIFDQMKRKSDRKSKTTIESRLPAKVNRKTKHRLDRSQFRFHENRLSATNLKFLLTCWRFWNYCQSCWNRKKMVDAKKLSKTEPLVENNLTTIFWSNMETHFWPLDDF